jgi:hypothetical protein
VNVDIAASLTGTPGLAIGIIAIVAGVVGALGAPVLQFFNKRHKQSGTVETSQAEDLWLNINNLLTEYKEDRVADRAELVAVRAELARTRAELVSTREALVAVQPMLIRLAQIEKGS